MFSLIMPEPVTVIRPTVGRDDLGEPTFGDPVLETVPCVVQPGATADLDATRPNGASVSYTLHFPKTYEGELRGCSVEVRGREYAIIGDPQRYMLENTPGAYNMAVEVGRTDG